MWGYCGSAPSTCGTMGGIARLRRSYVARRPLIDPTVRLRQKSAPSRLRNSQYGAWFVLDEVQNNRCGGVYAPDRSQPRKRNLFTYLNEFAASIPREEKQRVNRVDPGICGELACRRFLLLCLRDTARLIPGSPLVYKYSRASGSPSLNHPPPSLASLHHWLRGAPQRLCHVGAAASHALGALTAVVGIGVGGDVSEPLNMAGALDAGISAGAPRDWGALFLMLILQFPSTSSSLTQHISALERSYNKAHRHFLSPSTPIQWPSPAPDRLHLRRSIGLAWVLLCFNSTWQVTLTLFKVCYYAPYFSAERPKRLPLLWPYTTLDSLGNPVLVHYTSWIMYKLGTRTVNGPLLKVRWTDFGSSSPCSDKVKPLDFELEQGLELRCVREDFEQLPVEDLPVCGYLSVKMKEHRPQRRLGRSCPEFFAQLRITRHFKSSQAQTRKQTQRFRAHALRRRKTSRRLPSPNKSARGAAAASSVLAAAAKPLPDSCSNPPSSTTSARTGTPQNGPFRRFPLSSVPSSSAVWGTLRGFAEGGRVRGRSRAIRRRCNRRISTERDTAALRTFADRAGARTIPRGLSRPRLDAAATRAIRAEDRPGARLVTIAPRLLCARSRRAARLGPACATRHRCASSAYAGESGGGVRPAPDAVSASSPWDFSASAARARAARTVPRDSTPLHVRVRPSRRPWDFGVGGADAALARSGGAQRAAPHAGCPEPVGSRRLRSKRVRRYVVASA
ncbi:hypothetical protein B0H15DRAFT_964241 [Mycena belliarum]|uniref:Uncharacterized protein n=1 Tax=Mycena belliarum TaxID=1033014 RepID=A0AAD6XXQ5_9AGAR|nr:hypothetical protein B0H15DRAFT_964241 [Mycena belliae]